VGSRRQRIGERVGRLGFLSRQRLRIGVRWPSVPLDLRTDVKLLFEAALALLALNALLGMIEGQNRLTLPADIVNAHSHSGVLGWVTLGAIGFALMLFGPSRPTPLDLRLSRALTVLAVLSMVVYALASLAGSSGVTVVGSGAALLTSVALVGWLGMRTVQTKLEATHVAFLLAALALVFALTVGVLIEVQNITLSTLFPDDTAIVQPIVLDAGYLLLLGIALIEWGMPRMTERMSEAPTRSISISALALLEVILPFLAVCALAVSILMGVAALVPVAAGLEVLTGVLVLVRHGPTIRTVVWKQRGVRRSFAFAATVMALYLALFIFVLVRLSLGTYTTFGVVPLTITAAIDHLLYVGVLTNALFAALALLTRDGNRFWPATDDILFWGMNAGLLGFVGGLLVHNDVLAALLEGLFSPILGATILVGVIAYIGRLSSAPVRLSPPSSVEDLR
jgi:hypothetical protein